MPHKQAVIGAMVRTAMPAVKSLMGRSQPTAQAAPQPKPVVPVNQPLKAASLVQLGKQANSLENQALLAAMVGAGLIPGALIGAGNRPKRPVRGAVEGALGGLGMAGGLLPGAALGAGAGIAGAQAMNMPLLKQEFDLPSLSNKSTINAPALGLAALGALAGGGLGGYFGNQLGQRAGRGLNALTGDDRSDLDADQMMLG